MNILTPTKLKSLIDDALPGDQFVYYKGKTPRTHLEIFRAAMVLYDDKLVELVQNKIFEVHSNYTGGKWGVFEYIAIKKAIVPAY